jgi:hypothetical protein
LIPRPEGSPDVLLLAISGRCPIWMGCQPSGDNGENIDYLTPRGTVQTVADALSAQGLSVQSYGASASLTLHRPRRTDYIQVGAGKTIAATQEGFLQVEERLNTAYSTWIRGRSNPTRIVVMAHSHGVVWSHALARAHPEVPIAAMIDLDGVCDMWESDNRRSIQAYVKALGHNPWTFDLADSCGSVRVGHIRYDLKDVVYPNVAANLEVQSQRLLSRPDGSFRANIPFDGLKNVRPDGSRGGLQTFLAVGESHSTVSKPQSTALTWIKSQLGLLGAEWKMRISPFAQSHR